MKRLGFATVLVGAAFALVRCSVSGDAAAPAGGSFGGVTSGGAVPSPGDQTPTDPMLPPEEELEEDFRAPVATGRFVWTANPESNRVALIDASTFGVVTLDAGFGPSYLAALPGDRERSGAVVINTLSSDASVFFARDTSDVQVSAPVPIHPQSNAWAVSASGRWAIAWTNAARLEAADPTEGFQDVTVIDLDGHPERAPRATRVSVGYRPTRVVITDDEARALVVTEPGVSVIELNHEGGPQVVRDVVTADAPAAEVVVTPGGGWALARLPGSQQVNLVELESGNRTPLQLPGVVTDLDLSPDGSVAVAVIRGEFDTGTQQGQAGAASVPGAGGHGGDTADGSAGAAGTSGREPGFTDSTVAILPIPGIFSEPTRFTKVTMNELVGSVVVPAAGDIVLLFTNAVPSDRVTLLNILQQSWRTVELKAPVRALFAAPDGAHAVGLLSPPEGSTRAGAFSLIPVAENLPPKLQGTQSPTFGVALSTDNALITTRAGAGQQQQAFLAGFPSLRVDAVELPSAPTASGMVVDAGVAFVAQEHAEGRITFVDLEDAGARTLTGFELGLKVVDGD